MIDLNDEIKLWAGFTAREFWTGVGVMICLFLSCALGLSLLTHDFKLGFSVFVILSGPWILFFLYQHELPKGFLIRRWKQEGRFLFLHFRRFKGVDIYWAAAHRRDRDWTKALEDDHGH